MNKNNRLNAVDLFKLIFAFCIVARHTDLIEACPDPFNWYFKHLVFRLAVPYFFIVSGYFFGKKLLVVADDRNARLSTCRAYVTKLLPPFLFWGTIGLIRYGIGLYREHSANIPLKIIQTALFYPKGAMWYVLASILAVCVICLLWKHKKILITIGICGYGFALLCNSYYFLVSNTLFDNVITIYMDFFLTARNFIGVGIIYIGLGIWLSSDKCPIKNISKYTLTILLCLFEAAFIFEVWFIRGKEVLDDTSCFFVLPILSLLLVELTLRIKVSYSLEKSIMMRKISTDVYFSHPAFNSYLGSVLVLFLPNNVIIFAVVSILCLALWLVTRNSKNKFIRAILA